MNRRSFLKRVFAMPLAYALRRIPLLPAPKPDDSLRIVELFSELEQHIRQNARLSEGQEVKWTLVVPRAYYDALIEDGKAVGMRRVGGKDVDETD